MTAIAVLIGLVVVAGVTLSLVTADVSWLLAGFVLAVGLIVIAAAKSAHNQANALLVAVREVPIPASEPSYGPGSSLDMLRRDVQRDSSALLALYGLLPATGAMPAPGGWAATPETLLALVSEVLHAPKIGTVVECGSGTSTVWIASALKQRGSGRLISLEHDADYAAKTQANLVALGLAEYVEVRTHSLVWREVHGENVQWFPDSALDGITDVSVLFVDGPPGYLGPLVRYPALPLLADRLAEGACVVLDDTDRAEEQHVLHLWLGQRWAGRQYGVRTQTDRSTILVGQPAD
ncbi:class I SAM-dependent methyltransferase [Okibacterium endophyticum]